MEQPNKQDVRIKLTIAKQQGKLVEVHNIKGDEYFNVGFIVGFDNYFCLMISIDWDGKINGLIAIRIESIDTVKDQTDYLTTVSEKTKVAHENHYFDIWRVQQFLDDHPKITTGNILMNVLRDSANNHLPVVIGTKKYQGVDDFSGMIHDLNEITLNLHYFNEKDLSSMWAYNILISQIDYVRSRGTQMATTKQILEDVFHQD
ncbi:hypothetical protein [Limosilactobacillus fastidiosus]|uniref:Uncharacterized protein n=1 Tax=Limosilactobacillus fastidiosus TaxID=2759855 RepID=A0A7W3YD26_9LACO|nr:hypothetical protein [Limosilactobacillus fastidiosus]MBB1063590.1 hypothetical protein [Limosilactobacillus fastidiosus]MBB1086835.1 hypothetical protein [Limosilactobacillus fastidiosus]MCD7084166.1 hypothetical protein [Limosilactobacillus fastidiosus]MCD7085438.1 hypothetical protein [Limosilactobacillus fastidiosus]MCD7114669.1 hypothetical protein [Limosilactobacillus fastidiosus]